MSIITKPTGFDTRPGAVTIREVASLLDHVKIYGSADRHVAGFQQDSREVKENNLFIAVSGEAVDGHVFVGQAIAQGAAVVIVEKHLPLPFHVTQLIVPDSRKTLAILANFWAGEPSRKLTCIAVTGTNGKTTVTYLLQSILAQEGIRAGRLGTVNYDLGNIEIPAKTTTPDAPEIQKYLAHMCTSGCQAAVLEVSSHALSQHRTDCIDFDAAVFTNLSRDHLDYHGNMEEYRRVKGMLFASLKPEACAILNADDEASAHYARLCPGHTITYGLKESAQVQARGIATNVQRTAFTITGLGKPLIVETRLLGTYNVYNCLAAAACAWQLGTSQSSIKAGLETCAGPPGRLEPVNLGQEFTVLVDYAHTDDALHNVLAALKSLCEHRLLLVFGCGGNRDRGKRPRMAAVAERWADHVWLTTDNPRGERSEAIMSDIRRGIKEPGKFTEVRDRRQAIAETIGAAERGDVVLIAGKGHETYQLIEDKVFPFDDRQVARECLQQSGSRLPAHI